MEEFIMESKVMLLQQMVCDLKQMGNNDLLIPIPAKRDETTERQEKAR